MICSGLGERQRLVCNALKGRRLLTDSVCGAAQPLLRVLYWTIIFLIIALVAGGLGFGGLAGSAAVIAKVCFVIFIVLFLVSLIRGRKV